MKEFLKLWQERTKFILKVWLIAFIALAILLAIVVGVPLILQYFGLGRFNF